MTPKLPMAWPCGTSFFVSGRAWIKPRAASRSKAPLIQLCRELESGGQSRGSCDGVHLGGLVPDGNCELGWPTHPHLSYVSREHVLFRGKCRVVGRCLSAKKKTPRRTVNDDPQNIFPFLDGLVCGLLLIVVCSAAVLQYVEETKRPSKEMQVTIARQLGLEPTTVGNFFMNARRRSMDKWKDEDPNKSTVVPHEPQQHSPGATGVVTSHTQSLPPQHQQQQQQQSDVL
uniref:Uncharacterized protein n=1 Tax=Timema monikensis TaxID=170555 RepID=A0A7R9E9Q1_9NEOP|nr:unnamed protein product [Timema monikensis]